jgi:hypothetical protein
MMRTPRFSDRAAGVTLLVGYTLVIAILYRDPAAGIEQATRGVQAAVYFLVLPVVGIVFGAYAVLEGPHSGAFVFLAGSYLGVLGIALALGGVASAAVALVGVGVFVLSVVAVVTSVRSFVAAVGFDLGA